MNVLVWLMIGGLPGWLASLALQGSAPQKICMNVAIGAAGAVLSGGFVARYVAIAALTQGGISVGAVFGAFFGAIAALTIANLMQRTAAGIRW